MPVETGQHAVAHVEIGDAIGRNTITENPGLRGGEEQTKRPERGAKKVDGNGRSRLAFNQYEFLRARGFTGRETTGIHGNTPIRGRGGPLLQADQTVY